MRMIKVGDKYLGLVDAQSEAIRFPDKPITHGEEIPALDVVAFVIVPNIPGARVVKLKTVADRTADSMRALADDVEDDKT